MNALVPPNSFRALFSVLVILYTVASFIHFVHNAEFLAEYPNLPAWLGRAHVYLAWLLVFSVGLGGCFALGLGLVKPGLLLLAVYAAFGLAGLDHYWAAPVSAHTLGMNLTIGFEVIAALALLFYICCAFLRPSRATGNS